MRGGTNNISTHRRTIALIVALVALATAPRWGASSHAQQQPRYPVDPQTQRAVGAKQLPADELKRQLDGGAKVLIIEVRQPGKFAETLPGAINIPFDELEGYLRNIPKDTRLVFSCGTGRASSQAARLAEEHGFKSATFCPVNTWKEQGYQAEPPKKD